MNYNYIDVNELVISSQDVDNTYIALNENGEFVRTKIATGGGGEGGYVDLTDYYTKYEVDRKIENIEIPEPDLSDYYTKDEIEDIIDEIDLTPFVTEEELDLKEYVTETELQTRLENIDLSSYYTKTEIDGIIGDINNILETI